MAHTASGTWSAWVCCCHAILLAMHVHTSVHQQHLLLAQALTRQYCVAYVNQTTQPNKEPPFADLMDVHCLPPSPPGLQLKRLMLRDGSTAADAQARIDAQLPLSVKTQMGHVVIHNDADLALLQEQVSLRHSTEQRQSHTPCHTPCFQRSSAKTVLCYAMLCCPHAISGWLQMCTHDPTITPLWDLAGVRANQPAASSPCQRQLTQTQVDSTGQLTYSQNTLLPASAVGTDML
jgi:hypothetical protein